jgi:N-acetylglucosamine kinase-like BadF-type ATPase
MGYFLGVDVGATKTHALLADDAGQALGFSRAGPGNHQVVGYQGLSESIQTAVGEALAMAGLDVSQISGAGFGIGGYDWPSQLHEHLGAISQLGLPSTPEVVNDSIIALLAGASEGWGIVLIAGTGSNCRGRDQGGREARTTGEGERFGEFGGAGDLVDKAFHAVSHEWTRRGPRTALTKMFIDLAGAQDLEDLIEGIDLDRYRLEAAWAPKVFQAAHDGDRVAHEIIDWAGRQLGESACGVIRHLAIQGLGFDIVLAGSLFDGGKLFIDPLKATILNFAPHAHFIRLTVPPVVGAVALAMRSARLDPRFIRERLIESTRKMLKTVAA